MVLVLLAVLVAARGIGSVGPFGLTLVAALLVVGCMICTSSGARAWRASGDGAVALWPLLGLLAVVKVVENGTEYSLQSTLQQALFLPTSRDARYKGKAAIDTFVVRAGDVGSAAHVHLGTRLALGVQGFAVANVVIARARVLLVLRLARRHRRLTAGPVPGRWCGP